MEVAEFWRAACAFEGVLVELARAGGAEVALLELAGAYGKLVLVALADAAAP